MEIMLAGNSYFFVVFSRMSDRDHIFEGVLIFTTTWGYLLNLGIHDLIMLKVSPQMCQCGFVCHIFLLHLGEKTFFIKLLLFLESQLRLCIDPSIKKFLSYTRIYVKIDLNNPLPDSMEICLISSS